MEREGKSKVKNIYARGADDGFWAGLYIVAIFALMVLGQQYVLAGIPMTALVLGMPFLVYFFLRRTHEAVHGISLFSALWMQGIVMFACASLIFGAVAFVFLRWIDAGFLKQVLATVVEVYGESDQESSQMLARECEMILKSGMMPPVSQVVMSLMWMVVFSGSILSMACAMFVKINAHIRAIRKKK